MLNRQDLISACEKAIVNESQWSDRDSSATQRQVGELWALLKAGCDYKVIESNIVNTYDITVHFKGFNSFETGGGKESEYYYLPIILPDEGKDWY